MRMLNNEAAQNSLDGPTESSTTGLEVLQKALSTKDERDYMIDQIVGHVGKGTNTQYAVKWYGWKETNDSVQLCANIPLKWIAHYWRERRTPNAWNDKQDLTVQ